MCFLDFGMVGRLGRRERRQMAFVLWALAEGDFEGVADRLLRISTRRAGADPRAFRRAVTDAVTAWYGRESAEYSMARLLLRYLSVDAGYGIVFPRELMLLARALVNLESTASVIDEHFVLRNVTSELLPELRRTLLGDVTSPAEAWQRHRFDYIDVLLDLPDLVPELLERAVTAARDGSNAPGRAPVQMGRRAQLAAFALGTLTGAALRRRQ